MIFGKSDHDRKIDQEIKAYHRNILQQTNAEQQTGSWWAWYPVRLSNGRWVVWQSIWRRVQLRTLRQSDFTDLDHFAQELVFKHISGVVGRPIEQDDVIIGKCVKYALTAEGLM